MAILYAGILPHNDKISGFAGIMIYIAGRFITDAAELAAILIYGNHMDMASQPFGSNVENLKDIPEKRNLKG